MICTSYFTCSLFSVLKSDMCGHTEITSRDVCVLYINVHCHCMRRVISAGNLAEPSPSFKLSITVQSRYGGAHMIVKRRPERPLLFWLHCVSLFSETLGVGENPILRSMNSRAGRGGDNNSWGFGCSLHHTLWETSLWFIASPSSNIKAAVSHRQQRGQTWTWATLFTAGGLLLVDRLTGGGPSCELWCLLVSQDAAAATVNTLCEERLHV